MMRESERDSQEVSPGRTLKEDENDDMRTLEDEDSPENATEEQAGLFHETDNNSASTPSQKDPDDKKLVDLIAEIRNYIRDDRSVIFYVIALCYAINSEDNRDREGELIAQECNFFRTARGRSIAAFLVEKGATTRLELERELGIEETALSRRLGVLEKLGIVEKKGRVGAPYRAPNDKGAGIPIWRLKLSSPQASIEAQKRYGEIFKKPVEAGAATRVSKYTVDNIKAEIKDYLDSKGTKDASLREIYPHFKSIFTDFDDFSKACVELSREGYRIWR